MMTLAGARSQLLILILATAFTACGPSVVRDDDDDGVGSGDACAGESTSCPDAGPGGSGGGGGDDDCADGARLVYVVTDADDLLRFETDGDQYAFTPIGHLSCPSGPEWPARGGGPSHPYSMSVARDGRAWVLYTSGEIFTVSTVDASCAATSFPPDAGRFELFGMGFVADAAGTDAEHLYIAGGPATSPGEGSLGRIAPGSLAVDVRAPLVRGEFAPELSGTSAGELYAYYPGTSDTYVARLDPGSAQLATRWPLPALVGVPTGWAFAHWGGRFYVFITTVTIGSGATDARVLRLDPATGAVDVVLSGLAFKIVGAGVSTCAPIVIN
jgi:hypothetical protein